jgi:alkylation response protein AidB-like acyl-CoA dehydrogenase
MEFAWSPEQLALRERMRRIGAELDPHDEPDRDTAAEAFRAGWERLAREGVTGLPAAPSEGGAGYDPLDCALALEGLGHGCRDLGLLVSLGAHLWAVELPLLRFGSPQQRERYLPGLAAGSLIGAHAITESGAGSDSMALETLAEPKDGVYVLSGHKRFVTNGPVADVFLVYATINPRLGFTGVTAFLIDRDTPGLRVEPELDKSGLRSSPWARLTLDRCVVERDRVLGKEKQGSRIFGTVMAWERALLPVPLLGAMARCVEECIVHARSRRQFGARISSFQAVANRIVDMTIRLELARLAAYRAAWELGRGASSVFSEIAKLQVTEAAVSVFQDAMVLFGAAGFATETGIDRALRDALGTTLSSGTSDLQRVVIAGKLGLR